MNERCLVPQTSPLQDLKNDSTENPGLTNDCIQLGAAESTHGPSYLKG